MRKGWGVSSGVGAEVGNPEAGLRGRRLGFEQEGREDREAIGAASFPNFPTFLFTARSSTNRACGSGGAFFEFVGNGRRRTGVREAVTNPIALPDVDIVTSSPAFCLPPNQL